MSAFTKEELRAALTTHGVELPSTSAKKEELVALYEQFVEPLEKSRAEFSSDDEVEFTSSVVKKSSRRSSQKASGDKSQIDNGEHEKDVSLEDLSKLTDDQLADELRKLNIFFGPIVESTRTLYEKKLAKALGILEASILEETTPIPEVEEPKKIENGTNSVRNGEFSADEEEASQEETDEDSQPSVVVRKAAVPIRKSPRTPVKVGADTSMSLRQRFGVKTSTDTPDGRFTPTPRRSIHSYKVTETTTETVTKSPDGNISRDFTYKKETSDSRFETGVTLTKKIFLLLSKIIFFLILVGVAYYVFTNYFPDALDKLKYAAVPDEDVEVPEAEEPPALDEPAPDQSSIADV